MSKVCITIVNRDTGFAHSVVKYPTKKDAEVAVKAINRNNRLTWAKLGYTARGSFVGRKVKV